ncbi:hypothetical protein OG453_07315 [Streptomyces sp. NBC_01381]|uniref:hypothetical protein n=1 Tax=Streptomyces sp. NBC_01381 TaxID=2903845 RepID=UPI002254BDA1|nr:hypothetical protein [Streptomyces sp. NBC_01381]MCX4666477.1 hypothetical protein [Streptomyces sp. NBC_01381]
MRPIYHPAGHDDELRDALVELQAGRWRAARDLLHDTSSDWLLRTSRTQVLAVAAARSDVVNVWRSEEPDSYDAQVMHARVLVERTLRAHRQQHAGAADFEDRARRIALQAAHRSASDPVPWVCLLALAQVDEEQRRPEHREWSSEPMLPSGPWRLLHEVNQRDAYSREAFHRMLQFMLAQDAPQGASLAAIFDFGRWVASWAPVESPLLLLPVYAQVEQCRQLLAQGRRDPLWRRQWADEPAIGYTLKAFHEWFRKSDPSRQSVADLSHLAYALWVSHKFTEAAEVFSAIAPYGAREPWISVLEKQPSPPEGEALLLRACRESLSYAASHSPRAGPHPHPRLA